MSGREIISEELLELWRCWFDFLEIPKRSKLFVMLGTKLASLLDVSEIVPWRSVPTANIEESGMDLPLDVE